MITINPKEIPTQEFHSYMLGTVAPRPIAFASTLDENGIPNLAPYSFFNAYSSNPPTLVFSSNRRVRDNTTKDTFANIKATGEVVINMVSYNIVRQMALASIEYPSSVNEFEKAGLTPLPSVTVKPFRVAESPAQYECKVKQIIELGQEGGAGNLFICEVQMLHIHKAVLNEKGKIDPHKIDLCARMGDSFYARASGSAVFELHQPVNKFGIGFDNLPEKIKLSTVLTGNDLAQLASVEKLPASDDIKSFSADAELKKIFSNQENKTENIHIYAKSFLEKGDVITAWKVLLAEV
jgi:flavin reductase (DIM6/NTAB) family NADH-FMN oxidoreductase RutF